MICNVNPKGHAYPHFSFLPAQTILGALVARDPSIATTYDRILWITLGQTPDVAKLQGVLYRQLTDMDLPQGGGGVAAVLAQLTKAAAGKDVLMIMVTQNGLDRDGSGIETSMGTKALFFVNILNFVSSTFPLQQGRSLGR